MEKIASLFETLLERVTDYIVTTIELIRLKAVEKITDLAAAFISNVFVVGILIFGIFFLNVGLALWLGVLFDSMYLGFLAVGALHLLTVIILGVFFFKGLKKVFSNKIIKALLK